MVLNMSNETQVNEFTAGSQDNSTVSSSEFDQYIIVWESYLQDGSKNGIYAKIYNDNNEILLEEFLVNNHVVNHQQNPFAKSVSDNFVIVWESYHQDGSYFGIYSKIVDKFGVTIKDEFLVNTYTDGSQKNASIAIINNGFIVCWESNNQDGSGYGIYAQRFDVYGNFLGGEFQVNNNVLHDQYNVVITTSGEGFIAAWISDHPDNGLGGIFFKKYSTDLDIVISETQINNLSTVNVSGLSVVNFDNDRFVIAWESPNAENSSGLDIHLQIFNSDGSKFGTELLLNNYTISTQKSIDLTVLNNGNIVSTWSSRYQDGSGYGIFSKILNQNNEIIVDEFQVNSYTAGSQLNPSISELSSGGFVISWESNNQDGGNYGVYSQIFDEDGVVIEGFKIQITDVNSDLLINNNLNFVGGVDTYFASVVNGEISIGQSIVFDFVELEGLQIDINILDMYGVLELIGQEVNTMQTHAADINNDNIIDMTDLYTVLNILGSVPNDFDLIDSSGNRLSQLNHEIHNNASLTLVANGNVYLPELFSEYNASLFELI